MGRGLQSARDFARFRARRAGLRLRSLFVANVRGARLGKRFEPVDPLVRYPSYRSLDGIVDVERLRSLDGIVREGVERCLREGRSEAFDTGLLKRGLWSRRHPGSRVLPLTAREGPFDYFSLSEPEGWRPTPWAESFPELMDFVTALPFEWTSRIQIMCDDRGRPVTMHRDHNKTDVLHEFVWFRTNLDKPFFVADREGRERRYVRSYSAWFDTVNQFHGADGAEGQTISIRVDGRFTEELRARIPTPPFNRASTPSFWASLEGGPDEAG